MSLTPPSDGPPDLSHNPFLRIDNPWEGAGEQQAKRANEVDEFGRLCYSVFHQYEDGKRLWEKIKENYIMQTHVDPANPNSSSSSLWWDGFRAAMLSLYNHGSMHVKKINGAING